MRRIVAVFLALVSLAVMTAPGVSAAGSWVTGTYTNSSGSRTYKLWVPGGYTGGTAVPLVMMLHGCTQNPDDFAAGTQMNALADASTFLVVYPDQPSTANSNKCWNWFDTKHQSRGSGEPSLLAGIVDRVKSSYSVDATRVYVSGLSAGGAMTVIMGCAYPDYFTAIASHSGLEYKAATSFLKASGAMKNGGPDPNQQGTTCFNAMGSYERVVPALVFHGEADTTVYPVNGHQTLSQWAQTNDLASDGLDNGNVDNVADASSSGTTAAGYNYTQSIYKDSTGVELMQKWMVKELAHAWSGGSSSGTYTDPKGPNATQIIWDFFKTRTK